tara:strand:- start:10005 stop:10655 length:651 start_codon:yes stop_codon:yes gene_type:complete
MLGQLLFQEKDSQILLCLQAYRIRGLGIFGQVSERLSSVSKWTDEERKLRAELSDASYQMLRFSNPDYTTLGSSMAPFGVKKDRVVREKFDSDQTGRWQNQVEHSIFYRIMRSQFNKEDFKRICSKARVKISLDVEVDQLLAVARAYVPKRVSKDMYNSQECFDVYSRILARESLADALSRKEERAVLLPQEMPVPEIHIVGTIPVPYLDTTSASI